MELKQRYQLSTLLIEEVPHQPRSHTEPARAFHQRHDL